MGPLGESTSDVTSFPCLCLCAVGTHSVDFWFFLCTLWFFMSPIPLGPLVVPYPLSGLPTNAPKFI